MSELAEAALPLTKPTRPTRITVVTSGHLSTCPRMVKSADALAEAGYDVSVVATRHERWATAADVDARSRRTWPVDVIDYRRGGGGSTYWRTGAEHRAARAVAAAIGVARAPLPIVARAFARVHAPIVRAISAIPADLIYGGTTGALAAIAEAARGMGTPYALDLEDFHSAETLGPEAPFIDALATRVERDALRDAVFATASSEAIAEAYRERYDVGAAVVHNTFPLPAQAPDFTRADPAVLRIYWFSQTIGPGRGLDQAVAALGRSGVTAELVVRGRPHDGYLDSLRRLAAAEAPQLTLVHQPPAAPDAMVDLARGYDVGLALDYGAPLNRTLCMTNKAFIYVLAGVAVAMFDTPGQHDLAVDFGRAAALVPAGDVDALAGAFTRWAADPAALDCAKRTAWQAASRRWHWEHEAERGTLYRLVREVLS
jgi:glycosyltransferase involved in cell wall biosynthesis